jgi:ATP-dependent Clp protease ATP-binding subunit ClpA
MFKKKQQEPEPETEIILDAERLGDSAAALQRHLASRVIGQDHACQSVVNQMTNYFGGFNPPNRPLCVLFIRRPIWKRQD